MTNEESAGVARNLRRLSLLAAPAPPLVVPETDPAMIRACVDRLPFVVPAGVDPTKRASLAKAYQWSPGDQIRLAFLDGEAGLRQRVESAAKGWLTVANLQFLFTSSNADIRISFEQDGRSWSMLGKDCLNASPDRATMNYGWLKPDSTDDEVQRVVLHEFGHALGLIHEHQNPLGGIKWNKPAVYKYYADPPNNWSQADVDANIFAEYDKDQCNATAVDPTSIMMYPIPAELTLDGFSASINQELSRLDVLLIGHTYP